MRMYDIIQHKRDNKELSGEEIQFLLRNIRPEIFRIIRQQHLQWQFFQWNDTGGDSGTYTCYGTQR